MENAKKLKSERQVSAENTFDAVKWILSGFVAALAVYAMLSDHSKSLELSKRNEKYYQILAHQIIRKVMKAHIPERLFLSGSLSCYVPFIYYWDKESAYYPQNSISAGNKSIYEHISKQLVILKAAPEYAGEDNWNVNLRVEVVFMNNDNNFFVSKTESRKYSGFKINPCSFNPRKFQPKSRNKSISIRFNSQKSL